MKGSRSSQSPFTIANDSFLVKCGLPILLPAVVFVKGPSQISCEGAAVAGPRRPFQSTSAATFHFSSSSSSSLPPFVSPKARAPLTLLLPPAYLLCRLLQTSSILNQALSPSPEASTCPHPPNLLIFPPRKRQLLAIHAMHSCQLGPAACPHRTIRKAAPGPRRSNIYIYMPLATVGSTCSEMQHCRKTHPAAAPHTYELELWLISEQNTQHQRAGLPG